MNFKSILVVGLSIATLGLSLPAHAGDQGTVIDNQQGSSVYGNDNHTNQTIKNKVTNKKKGHGGGDTGTSITNGQGSDVVGDGNKTNQKIKNTVLNKQKTSH